MPRIVPGDQQLRRLRQFQSGEADRLVAAPARIVQRRQRRRDQFSVMRRIEQRLRPARWLALGGRERPPQRQRHLAVECGGIGTRLEQRSLATGLIAPRQPRPRGPVESAAAGDRRIRLQQLAELRLRAGRIVQAPEHDPADEERGIQARPRFGLSGILGHDQRVRIPMRAQQIAGERIALGPERQPVRGRGVLGGEAALPPEGERLVVAVVPAQPAREIEHQTGIPRRRIVQGGGDPIGTGGIPPQRQPGDRERLLRRIQQRHHALCRR